MRKKWLWVGVALICVTVWYLARGKPQRFPGKGVIVEFVREGHWLSVFAGPTAKRTELAALEQLGAFHPGLSPDDAAHLYGRPDRVIGPENGAEYAEYHNRYGRIRLGYEESADGVDHPLYFFPYDSRPEAFFPGVIVSQIGRAHV